MKKNTIKRAIGLLGVLGVTAGAGSVASASLTYIASGTNPNAPDNALSASATFDVSGNDLVITLQNTGAAASVPSDVLTAFYFSISGNPTLTPLAISSGTILNPSGTGGNLAGNWEYAANITAPGGANSGISSTGLGIFGKGNFPGGQQVALDGVGYGIADGIAANANKGVTSVALIDHSVTFTFSGLPSGFNLSAPGAVTDVGFQYGSQLTEPYLMGAVPSVVPIPEPSTVAGAGLLLAFCAVKLGRSRFGGA
jgi:hypothetical protein